MTRRPPRTIIDLRIVRATLDSAETIGVPQAAANAGVSWTVVYEWRRRRTASDGVWPSDSDIAAWDQAYEAGAARRAQARQYVQRVSANGGPMLVDSLGARRRLHALQAIGWRLSDLSASTGREGTYLSALARGKHPRITVAMAQRIADLYDQLSGTPGPSSRTRAFARSHGWVPPLAWDEDTIDDPAATPAPVPTISKRAQEIDEVAVYRATHGDRVTLTTAERRAAVRVLADRGHSERRIAEILAVPQRVVSRDKAAA